jgi:hypothetical protein
MLATLPIEVQIDIAEMDPEVYKLYPLLCKSCALTRFSFDMEKHYKWFKFDRNGLLTAIKSFYHGKKDGIFKKWYSNGQLWEELNYKDDKRDGRFKKWHNNGQLWWECTFKDDKLEGSYKQWYDNGQLWEICTYKKGKRDGPYKKWHYGGGLWMECIYKEGNYDLSSVPLEEPLQFNKLNSPLKYFPNN